MSDASFEKSFRKAISATEAQALPKWLRKKTLVMAGEYQKEEVTENYTADGLFSILPSGRMIYAKASGSRGPMMNRWSWNGYSMKDHRPNIQRWESKTNHYNSVKSAKRAAERTYLPRSKD